MSQPKLLIVDDDPGNLMLMRLVLEDDYTLSFAHDGAEALAQSARVHPELILLDIGLPDLDGYEVCRRLKKDPVIAKVPVIFVTASNDPESEEVGFQAGCVDYLTKPITPGIVRARVRTHLSLVQTSELENSYRDAVFMLGRAGHYNDSDTGVHIWRMAAYARTLAETIGWDRETAALLELAAVLHDTGKIGIPDSVLRKPGPLSPEEWEVIKRHTLIGHDILTQSQAPVFRMAAEIALHHHERWDGGGYPHGLAGEDIPESARIVALVDVFDALSMKRPYKDPWPLERILEYLRREAGRHFEPRLVAAFEDVMPRILLIKAIKGD